MEEKRKAPVSGSADVSRRMSSANEPRPLPYSDYPTASDVAQHGLQPLPASLPLVDFAQAKPCRSSRYSTMLATELTMDQLLQMAWVIATGFARREPQARYLRPPKHPPAGLMEARHTDPFGTDSFGSWDTETQMYWIVRLTALTDPTSPQDAIEVNEETLTQSLAILDGEQRVIGAAFNETMAPLDVQTSPLNVRRIGGVTMAENHSSTRPPITRKAHRCQADEDLVARFICHANSTRVLQSLWRGLVGEPYGEGALDEPVSALEPVYGRVEHRRQKEGDDEPTDEGPDLPEQEERAKHHGRGQEGYGHRAHHLSRRGACPTSILAWHGRVRFRRCRFGLRLRLRL